MRWYHIFSFPKYISALQEEREQDKQAQVNVNKVLLSQIDDLAKELRLLQDTMYVIEKRFAPAGIKNEIEEKDEDWDEVDENYRIPIVTGIKVAEEGQDIAKATPLNIYGFGDPGVQPPKVYGSRQGKKKTN